MRILRLGCAGADVSQWQYFLTGCGFLHTSVTGTFDAATEQATKDFQRIQDLEDVDGVVGPMTLGAALKAGFNILVEDPDVEDGPDWPPRPTDVSPLCMADRKRIFGQFGYVAAPTVFCLEAIKFTDNWPSENMETVTVPQLVGLLGAPANGGVQFHKLASAQLVSLFQAWYDAGLIDRVKSWAGSWAPRFIRGSRTVLSNHAIGTAFDINSQWNHLGAVGALKGQHGSTRELVALAVEHGFYFGGWFDRRDPMHFEVYKVL